jgi:hypothetical protein
MRFRISRSKHYRGITMIVGGRLGSVSDLIIQRDENL